jgi:hypothetical protein
MGGVQARLEGTTLVVRIPMRFQRRGGRKRIVAPDGNEIAPTSKPAPDGTLVKVLARADLAADAGGRRVRDAGRDG